MHSCPMHSHGFVAHGLHQQARESCAPVSSTHHIHIHPVPRMKLLPCHLRNKENVDSDQAHPCTIARSLQYSCLLARCFAITCKQLPSILRILGKCMHAPCYCKTALHRIQSHEQAILLPNRCHVHSPHAVHRTHVNQHACCKAQSISVALL